MSRKRYPAPSVDLRTVLDHIIQLRNAGMDNIAIAETSGIPIGTISNISRSSGQTVYGHTAARILAITTPVVRPPARLTHATATRRQIQALATIGHSLQAIRNRTGISPRAMYLLLAGRSRWVSIEHADTVAALYRDWSDKPGTSKRGMTNARKHGWQPPIAWDDDTIADPTAKPHDSADVAVDEVAVYRAVNGDQTVTLTPVERSEAVRVLTRRGHSQDEIADRLGIADRTVCRWRSIHRMVGAA